MFLDLFFAPITAPLSGVSWIGSQILDRANAELDDKENLSKLLLALQLAFDMGDISEEEFEAQEEELLLAIQAADDAARSEAAEEEEEG